MVRMVMVCGVVACSPAELEAVSERVPLEPYASVEMHANLDAVVWFGAEEQITTTCDPGEVPRFASRVEAGRLFIEDPEPEAPSSCTADVRMLDIHTLINRGPGLLQSPADLAGRVERIVSGGTGAVDLATAGVEGLEVIVEDAADVEVGVRAWERLELTHDSTGEAHLRGMDLEAAQVGVRAGGSAFLTGSAVDLRIDARNSHVGAGGLAADRVELDVRGGSVVVQAEERVVGSVRGAARLVLIGPCEVDLELGPDVELIRRP